MKLRLIGAFAALGLLLSQAPAALAIYSPVISKDVSRIKQDVFAARQKNGEGTWLNALEKIEKNNKTLKASGQASGTSGTFPLFSELAKKIVVQAATESFLDGFRLLIPSASGISTCLRDDIWELQALQEEVLNEMFKASLLSNLDDSNTLYGDYKQLQNWIEGDGASDKVPGVGIRKGFKDPNWFPGQQNYYVDCPYGSISLAIDEAKTSLNRLIDIFSRNFSSMGSLSDMWNIAKKRAVEKAAAYIAKNQIQVSFGGEAGANPEGLVNGNGIAGLSNTLNEAKRLLKDEYAELLVQIGKFLIWGPGEIYSLATGGEGIPKMCTDLGLSADCAPKLAMPPNTSGTSLGLATNLEDVSAEQDLIQSRIFAPLTLGIQLNYVSEQSLRDIEAKMLLINLKIQEVSNQDSIPKMCDELNAVLAKQCSNKQSNAPVNCKD